MPESNEELDITRHIYVPKHEVLSSEEAQEVLKGYNATAKEFPYILSSDPVVRRIGGKPGDIVKVTRITETAGVTAYYRYVVEG